MTTSSARPALPQSPAPAPALSDLVDSARRLIANGKRHVLGITGTPGAGKSTVSDALLAALGSEAVLVGMDGFHLSNHQLRRLGRAERKGAPDTFDVAGYRSLLSRIRAADEDVYAPVFDRRIEESIAAAAVVPVDVPLVLTEGNYLLLEHHGWASVRRLLDTVWYIDVAPAERVRRLEARRRSHGHDAVSAAAWVRDVDERNAAIVEPTRARADRVVRLETNPAETDSASHMEGAGA
jgi:pantothenate kinase